MQKSRVKIMLAAFFDAKGIIHKFVPETQTVNGKFYKVMKRLIARVHRVRPEFQENGSWFLLYDNAPAHSSSDGRNEGSILSHPPYSPVLAPVDFYFLN
jgi:hypothetical protein